MYLLWILRPCLDNKLLNCSNAGLSLCCSWVQPRAHYTSACLLGSPRLGTLSPFCPAEGSEEEQHISFCFRYVFAGANHRAGFSPWRAIGWFNTMPTGKRRQAANCVQNRLNRALDHASCADENDSSLPRPTCNLRLSLVWQ